MAGKYGEEIKRLIQQQMKNMGVDGNQENGEENADQTNVEIDTHDNNDNEGDTNPHSNAGANAENEGGPTQDHINQPD